MTIFCLILCTAEVRSWISIPNRRVPSPMNVGRPTCRYRRHVTVINFIIKRKEKKYVFTHEKCYIIKGMLRCLAPAPKRETVGVLLPPRLHPSENGYQQPFSDVFKLFCSPLPQTPSMLSTYRERNSPQVMHSLRKEEHIVRIDRHMIGNLPNSHTPSGNAVTW